MLTQHLARNTLVTGTLELAESLGVSADEILDEIGLDPKLARTVGALVPSEAIIDAVELAAVKSGRNDFGLMLGARQDHRLIGPLGLLFEQATSITELQEFSDRFFHLHNTALKYTLTRRRGRGLMRLQIRAKGLFVPRHYVECLFVIVIRMARIILGPKWRPASVLLQHHRLANRSAYERYFGAATRFEQGLNGIVCTEADFVKRSEPRNPEIKLKLQAMLQELDSHYDQDVAAKVSHVIRVLLPAGQASIESSAKLLSLTPRTLQRKLRAQDTNFTSVMVDTRVELAREYLRSGHSVTRIAPMLGFSEASAVSRFLRQHIGAHARDLRRVKLRS